jgi:hypothetical protein
MARRFEKIFYFSREVSIRDLAFAAHNSYPYNINPKNVLIVGLAESNWGSALRRYHSSS